MAYSILAVDDEETILRSISRKLDKEGYQVELALSGQEALRKLRISIPDLVLLDLKMPGLDGLETLKEIKKIAPETIVIMMTSYGTIESAVEAMKQGAYDFITKSVTLDDLKIVVRRALEVSELRDRIDIFQRQEEKRYCLDNLIRESPAVKEIYSTLQTIILNDKATVLIQGETGTGKEHIAKIIHYNSSRATRPFVEVNCSAIPQELFESELFGYEKGAFTGADRLKKGQFELANGGTLFLDEIGDLDNRMQIKLLRALQEKRFKRVGGTRDIQIDVRIIAATNRDLKKAIQEGTFREDLYFRLKVIPIELAPLRKSREDIIPLAENFIVEFNREFKKNIRSMDQEVKEVLMNYPFPGNIRELENIIERAMIFCFKDKITTEHLPKDLLEGSEKVWPITPESDGGKAINLRIEFGQETLGQIEKSTIHKALEKARGNKTLAAKYLGITRFALNRRLQKYHLTAPFSL